MFVGNFFIGEVPRPRARLQFRLISAAVLVAFFALLPAARLTAQTNYHDPKLESLIIRQQRGDTYFEMARQRRNGELARLEADLRAKKITEADFIKNSNLVAETFKKTSQRLTRRYRAPIIERMSELMPGLRDTLGTGFYVKNPNGTYKLDGYGNKIINPAHRGYKGDFDFKGDSTTLSDLDKYMRANGAALSDPSSGRIIDTSGRADGSVMQEGVSQKSIKKLEFTVNRETIRSGARSALDGANDRVTRLSGQEVDLRRRVNAATGSAKIRLERELASAQKDLKAAERYRDIKKVRNDAVNRRGFFDSNAQVGSAARSDVLDIRANDVETFNSASMRRGTVYRRSVEVEDHIKKASKGLGANPGDAHSSTKRLRETFQDNFQTMTKSTLKAIDATGLSDADLAAVLANNGYQGGVGTYRAELGAFRSETRLAAGQSRAEIRRLQAISKDVLAVSRVKAARLDAARLKSLEKSMVGADAGRQAQIRAEIIDGRENLRASRRANLTRENVAGFKLKPPPEIPATSGTPDGGWFLGALGVNPNSSLGTFLGPPAADSAIMKHGGPMLTGLGVIMIGKSIFDNAHKVADDKGLVLPAAKLSLIAISQALDVAGISLEQFQRGFTDDLRSANTQLDKYGIENSLFRTPLQALALGLSVPKTAVTGAVGLFTQTVYSSAELAALGISTPKAYLDLWRNQSDTERRLATDARFRQAMAIGEKRQRLGVLELDKQIFLTKSGLSGDWKNSAAGTRAFLAASIDRAMAEDNRAITRIEAKTGKMTDAEKQSFRAGRAAKRRYDDNDRLARWDRATEAQDALRARLIGIETALAKPAGSYTPKQYEGMRRDLGDIGTEMKALKDIVQRMSAMDRAAIMGRDAESLAKGRNSVIDNGDRLALGKFREWMKNSDSVEARITGLARTNRIDALVFDTKRQAGDATPATLADLLQALGDPTRSGLADLTELAALGLDATAVISALTAQDIKPKRDALARALGDLKRDSNKARDGRKKRRLALKEPTQNPVQPATPKKAAKPKKTKKTIVPLTATAPPVGLWGAYSGRLSLVGGDGMVLLHPSFGFTIRGTRVTGRTSGNLFYTKDINNPFTGKIKGNYNPKTGEIAAKLFMSYSDHGTRYSFVGVANGKKIPGGFKGKWSGQIMGGTWRTSGTDTGGKKNVPDARVDPVSWDAYMCQHYRDAFIQSGGVCN